MDENFPAESVGFGDDILIVDDDPGSHVALEAVLASLGRRLVSVSSGRDALAKLLEQDFALIVLDVNMPDLDGLETARLIRSRGRNRETPIVFVTGTARDEAIEDAYAAGGFEFLNKPVRPQVLLAKVRLYLGLQDRTRALQAMVRELRASQEQIRTEERKRIDAEASASRLRLLSEQQAERHAFISILSHELRHPFMACKSRSMSSCTRPRESGITYARRLIVGFNNSPASCPTFSMSRG